MFVFNTVLIFLSLRFLFSQNCFWNKDGCTIKPKCLSLIYRCNFQSVKILSSEFLLVIHNLIIKYKPVTAKQPDKLYSSNIRKANNIE